MDNLNLYDKNISDSADTRIRRGADMAYREKMVNENVRDWGRAIEVFNQLFPEPDAPKARAVRNALISAAECDGLKIQVEQELQPKPGHERVPSEKALEAMSFELREIGPSSEAEKAAVLFKRDFRVISGSFVPSFGDMYGVIDEELPRTSPAHALAMRVLKAGAQADGLTLDQITPPFPGN